MNYAVEMGSSVMIYIPSFIKICSAIQKLKGEISRHADDGISLLLFFKEKVG
jgi:hypothetical protein